MSIHGFLLSFTPNSFEIKQFGCKRNSFEVMLELVFKFNEGVSRFFICLFGKLEQFMRKVTVAFWIFVEVVLMVFFCIIEVL